MVAAVLMKIIDPDIYNNCSNKIDSNNILSTTPFLMKRKELITKKTHL